MSYTGAPLNLEKMDYVQSGWNAIHNSNLDLLNDWAASLEASAALNLGKLSKKNSTTFQISARQSGAYDYVMVAGKKVSISTAKENDVAAVNTIDSDGLDSGSLPSTSTTYYAYLSNSEASLSEQLRLCATAPTNGYIATNWRHVGEVTIDGSGNVDYTNCVEASIVKALLELLSGDNRLDISAIKGISTSVPVGSMVDFAGASSPEGWILCYGQAISRVTYSDLFGVIGTTFGSGDGSTTFNLPDFRGRVAAGLDNLGGSSANTITNAAADSLGGTLGTETHTLDSTQIPAHSHSYALPAVVAYGGSPNAINAGSITASGATGNTGGGLAHNNVQPTIFLSKIIKY
jgi:microcystin-dependent protein